MWFLPTIYIIATTGQWFTNLYSKQPVQNEVRFRVYWLQQLIYGPQLQLGNNHTHPITTWLFYVIAICFDFTTLCVSTYYLLRYYSPSLPSSRVTRFVKVMIYDGIGYFVILTGTNVLNLVIFNAANGLTRPSGASLGIALTWIMSQRILIHLRDAAADHRRSTRIITEPLRTAQSVSYAMRSQFDTKGRINEEFGVIADRPLPRSHSLTDLIDLNNEEFPLQVRVERSVVMDYDSMHQRESDDAPRAKWTQGTPPSKNNKEDLEIGPPP
ncbi:uncharacterized protein FIBRA_06159 [Fibroporia radiculosa]|uniref:Uncharacterized protein n=1 Tax=Fibroporia radiculosa TaxID=599839 RepID=J4HYN9_9APHY|nr:uncharacterized protein FIBRA_06159 [Fibroporia radiculosa]CCM04002.1 predicted protein [Fibroporia radiculosa]